jgi:hypothetical protein
MEVACSSETSIEFQQTTRFYIQEDITLITTAVRTLNYTKRLKISEYVWLPTTNSDINNSITLDIPTHDIPLGLMFKHKRYFQIPFQENDEIEYYEICHGRFIPHLSQVSKVILQFIVR